MLSYISRQNCTNTPLGAGETFTGRSELHLAPDAMITCFTDAPGTLYLEFSIDEGSNFDSRLTFDVNAGFNEFHTAVKGARSTRVRLVNGSTPQTVLRLQLEFGEYRQGNAPLNGNIAADADASIVRSVSADLDLAFGKFSGIAEDAKFGVVYDIDTTSSEVDLWMFASGAAKLSNRSNLINWPASAATLYMSSDSASDTDLDLVVTYIDANGLQQDLEYNYTAGQTGASLGVTGYFINRVEVVGATLNAGNLYFTQTNAWTGGVPNTLTSVIAFVYAGYGQTQQCAYWTPNDKRVRIKEIDLYLARASGADGSSEIHLLVRKPGGAWLVKRDFQLTNGSPLPGKQAGLVFPAGTQFRLSVPDVSDNDTNLNGTINYELIDA